MCYGKLLCIGGMLACQVVYLMEGSLCWSLWIVAGGGIPGIASWLLVMIGGGEGNLGVGSKLEEGIGEGRGILLLTHTRFYQ